MHVLQVLDDSTDRTTRDLVDDKVVEWRERGVNIEVMRRTNRAGYKAGALKEVRKSSSTQIASASLLLTLFRMTMTATSLARCPNC